MTRTRKIFIIILVTVLLGAGVFIASLVYAGNSKSADMEASREIYRSAENVMESFFAADDSGEGDSAADILKSEIDNNDSYAAHTPKVTVYDKDGALPYSGTVTKSQDAFYPGTYKLNFSSNAILTSDATVVVNIDVKPGENVYILTGNKELGYKEYKVVTAKEIGSVEFTTNVLQNYTVSTTDICSAQEAMADIVGN